MLISDPNEISAKLHAAAEDGSLPRAKRSLEAGANVGSQGGLGNSAAHHASYMGRLDCLAWLIENGADVELKNGFGQTVISPAIGFGRLECIKLLIEKGASLESENMYIGKYRIEIKLQNVISFQLPPNVDPYGSEGRPTRKSEALDREGRQA